MLKGVVQHDLSQPSFVATMDTSTTSPAPSTAGEPSRPRRRIPKLRITTCFVVVFVATFFFLLNYATFAIIEHDFSFRSGRQAGEAEYLCPGHGWPWTFLRREGHGRESWNVFAGAHDFDPFALWANAAVAVAMTAGVGLALQRRSRSARRWFQVRLSTVLMVILIVACGVQYLLRQYRAYDLLQRARATNVQLICHHPQSFGPLALGGCSLPTRSKYAWPAFIGFDGYAYGRGLDDPRPLIGEVVSFDPSASSMRFTITSSWRPGGAFEWVFEIPFQNIHCSVSHEGTFEPLKRMKQLRHLCIEQPTVDDLADLADIGELSRLELLAITGPGMKELTDDDIRFLATLNNLKVLAIGPCRVTGAVLKYAASMPALRTLCLAGCPLRDEDLAPLTRLTELRRLEIDAAIVSDEALDKLKRSSPWLTVVKLNELD